MVFVTLFMNDTTSLSNAAFAIVPNVTEMTNANLFDKKSHLGDDQTSQLNLADKESTILNSSSSA